MRREQLSRGRAHGEGKRAPPRSSPKRQLPGAPVPPTLIEPRMTAFMGKLAAGEVEQRPWTLTSPPGIHPALLPFIQSSGDFTKLAEALESTPSLLRHPVVHGIICHLRAVHMEYWEDHLGYKAMTILRQLVEAAASGLLGGAWSLKPLPGRPGRKATRPEDIELGLLHDAESLMESLREENLRKSSTESDAQRTCRVAHIVERVWDRSWLSKKLLPGEPKPGQAYDKIDIRWERVPLPCSTEILEWVKKAYKQSRTTGRPIRSQLIWKMLGHRYGLTEGQVRGRIDTARAWEKKDM